MQIDSVKKYLTSSVKTPYFLFISDGQYKTAIYELSLLGLDFVQMSGFCGGDDKPPDIDGLLTYIEAADVNAKSKKFVVTGLGEYLALRGQQLWCSCEGLPHRLPCYRMTLALITVGSASLIMQSVTYQLPLPPHLSDCRHYRVSKHYLRNLKMVSAEVLS